MAGLINFIASALTLFVFIAIAYNAITSGFQGIAGLVLGLVILGAVGWARSKFGFLGWLLGMAIVCVVGYMVVMAW